MSLFIRLCDFTGLNIAKPIFAFFSICFIWHVTSQSAHSQPLTTANDVVTPYTGVFQPGINLGYYPTWSKQQMANIAAGNTTLGIPGVGAKSTRPSLSEEVLGNFGYNSSIAEFQTYQAAGMGEFAAFVGGTPLWNKDFTNYCPGLPSVIYKNLYEPIWDNNNGTPYNENNPYAAYLYQTVNTYKDYVTFWEIWNEPGFDFSNGNGRKNPGELNNWWDNDPSPCDYALLAPIEYYVRMLRISYEIVKTLDPTALVVVGDPGYPAFLDAILRNTDNPLDGSVTSEFPLKGGAYFDCMNLHSYPHFDFTAYDPNNNVYNRHSDGAAFGLIQGLNRYQTVLSNRGYDGVTYPKKEWVCTEYNTPRVAYSGPYLSGELLQRNYIIKALAYAHANKIHRMDVFQLFDAKSEASATSDFDLMGMYKTIAGGVNAYNQVVNDQGKAMKTYTDLVFNTMFDSAQTAALALPDSVGGFAFKQTDNEYVYVLWAKTRTDSSEVAAQSYTFPSTLGLTQVEVFAWDYGYSGTKSILPSMALALTGTPIFIKKYIPTPCILTATATAIQCSDNGTPSLPSDDVFSFQILAQSSGSDTTTLHTYVNNQLYTGTYGNAFTISNIAIANGPLTLEINDSKDTLCNTTIVVTPPNTCSNQPANQYCNTYSEYPWHEWIARVKVGSLDKTSSKATYSNFTLSSTTLASGTTHPMELTVGYSYFTQTEYVNIWIDYNKNKIFEASELAYQGILTNPPIGTLSQLHNIALQIPANAAEGSTRMRISMRRGAYPDPCGAIDFGEVEDYTVSITAAGSCSINATITNIACNNNNTPTITTDDTFTFSTTVNGQNTGTAWIGNVSSTTTSGNYDFASTVGPFSVLSGTITMMIHDQTNTNCATTVQIIPPPPCSNGGGGGTYCESKGDFPWEDWIAQIKLSDLTYVSGKSQYSNFLAQTSTVTAGQTYPIQLTTGFSFTPFDEYWGVWIDYDKNGEFAPSELAFDQFRVSPQFPSGLWSTNGEVTIPAGAPTGITRMRIVMRRGNTLPLPCGTFPFGETEDYSINILPSGGGQSCTILGQSSNISCQNQGTAAAGDDKFSYTITVTGAGTGASTGWTAIAGTDTLMGTYSTPVNVNGKLIANGNINYTIRDNGNPNCTQTLTVQAPAPCSQSVDPCKSKSNHPWHEWIAGVSMNNINYLSGKSEYSNFTSQNILATAGLSYQIHLKTGYSYNTFDEYWRIWIDYNNDGTFDDDEIVLQNTYPTPPNGTKSITHTDTITIPQTVSAGTKKMRVSMKRGAYPTACETLPYGEVEDYSITIDTNSNLHQPPGQSIVYPAQQRDEILLFPNPAGKELNVQLSVSRLGSNVQCTFINTLGQTVKVVQFTAINENVLTIPLHDLDNGQYFLYITSPGVRSIGKVVLVMRDY